MAKRQKRSHSVILFFTVGTKVDVAIFRVLLKLAREKKVVFVLTSHDK